MICPTGQFDRDKHAEMVVRALKKLGVDRARVNERHDIVLDPQPGDKKEVTRKVSGSAYKLTRLRSLHHGTCLLRSSHLDVIGQLLKSPAKPYITARGVDSVPSPIRNVGVKTDDFVEAVTAEFQDMYEHTEPFFVEDGEKQVPDIRRGLDELKVCSYLQGIDLLQLTDESNLVQRMDIWPNTPILFRYNPHQHRSQPIPQRTYTPNPPLSALSYELC